MGNRFTIAVLADYLITRYVSDCLSGILDAAGEKDIQIISYFGGGLHAADRGRNHLFNYPVTSFIDGILCITGAISDFAAPEDLTALSKKYGKKPFLSLGGVIDDVPSLLADNKQGMGKLLDHLILHHHCRRIAFIKGPEEAYDACRRFEAYREALEKHNLPYDPALVVQGDFMREGGIEGVKTLLDQRQVSFDALAASDDVMANYAIEELQRRGIDVPRDVLVTGFDNSSDAFCATPPLTTVNQPVFKMGYEGVNLLERIIQGENIPPVTLLETDLVVRSSCGCLLPDVEGARFHPGQKDETSGLLAAFPSLSALLGTSLWAGELIREFQALLEDNSRQEFFLLLKKWITLGEAKETDRNLWLALCLDLFELPGLQENTTAETLNGLRKQIIFFVNTTLHNIRTYHFLRDNEIFTLFQELGNDLNTISRIEDITDALSRDLADLGANFFQVTLFGKTRDQGTVLFLYDPSGRLGRKEFPRTYNPGYLVPGDGMNWYGNWAVFPLFAQDELMGHVLCDIKKKPHNVMELLCRQLSFILKGIFLQKALKENMETLERMVDERTTDLVKVHKQLSESAHQAGMAEIATGILHDVGNILNSTITGAQLIQMYLSQIKINGLEKVNSLLEEFPPLLESLDKMNPALELKDKSTTLSNISEYYKHFKIDLESIRDKISQEANSFRDKLDIIKNTIRTQREYALKASETEEINLIEILNDVLLIGKTDIFKRKVWIHKEFSPGEDFLVMGQKPKLFNILVNLIKNSYEAMVIKKEEDMGLKIRLHREKEQICLDITDRGHGFSAETREKLFSFGYSTKKKSRGLGLYMCQRYMEEMNGIISAESPGEGKGATFTLCLQKM